MRTLKEELEKYVTENDLAAETRAWYRRVASVYCGWVGSDPPADSLDEVSLSRFLSDKQDAGRSPYYLNSLRKGLVAVLRALRAGRPVSKIRSIKCPPLEPDGWTAAEIERLISPGCDPMPESAKFKWQLCILLAYYLGLDRCDIERLEQKHFAENGALVYRRRKTGGKPSGGVPLELLIVIRTVCPIKGPICRMNVCKEWFRKVFASIVVRAGLFGTFKKVRKSSGSLVEAIKPGMGHKHLGNTRAIFEKHYEARRLTRTDPTIPPNIKLPWDKPPDRPAA